MQHGKNHIVKYNHKTITIFDLSTLTPTKTIKTTHTVSALYASGNSFIYGTTNGEIFLNDYNECKIIKTYTSHATAIFIHESLVGVGTDDGHIYTFILGDSIKEISAFLHSAPILKLVTDGIDTLVYDFRKRITHFPTIIAYDNFNPLLVYKKYAFAADGCDLYCRTKSSFSVYMHHERKITDVVFSEKGSVVFLYSGDKISVYDFNKRKILREFECKGGIFDEKRNRWIDSEFKIIENVADARILVNSMENIYFTPVKIENKYILPGDENDTNDTGVAKVKYKGPTRQKMIKVKYVNKETESDYEGEIVESEEDLLISRKKKKLKKQKNNYVKEDSDELENLFEDDKRTDEEEDKNNELSLERSIESRPQFMPSSIQTNSFSIFSYNKIGALTSTKTEFYSNIELKYHENSRPPFILKDTNFCTMGSFSHKNLILANSDLLLFYGEGIEWSHKTGNVSLVGVSDELLCVVYGDGCVRMYRPSGLEIFNCVFKRVNSVLVLMNSIFLLLENEFLILNFDDPLKVKTERQSIVNYVDWFSYENERFYYYSNKCVYMVYNGLSIKVGGEINNLLCVSNDFLISLKNCSFDLNVEYTKIRMDVDSRCTNLLNFTVLGVDMSEVDRVLDECRSTGKIELIKDIEWLVYGKSGVQIDKKSEIPKNYREFEDWNTETIVLNSEESIKKTPTKKFSPFKKK